MSNLTLSFLFTTFAGFSTLLGCLPLLLKNTSKNLLIKSLAFAAGVMLTLSFYDLIPESFRMLNSYLFFIPTIMLSLICLLCGFIFSFFLDKYLPSENRMITDKKLYKTGIISLVAIIFHNIPEGVITFLTSNYNVSLGISLTLAIILHNIPEGISISIPIYYATGSKRKAFFYTFISSLSEPLGGILAYMFLSKYINSFIMGILFSFIAGLMIHISLCELLPTSNSYKKKNLTLTYFLLGIIIMLISLIFI